MSYCIINTTSYNGDYTLGGTYNSQDYFQGMGGFIFSSSTENRWCLAANLGDPCVQFGPYASTSTTPDLDPTVMYPGLCVTTTTTTDPCATFDFSAVFDCLVPSTPTPTPTSTTTPTPTPTPSASNPCGGVSLVVTSSGYTPTPTASVTPTPTPTPQVTRPCNFSGEVIFNSFTEVIQCANSKRFKDCFTGINYYTSDLTLFSGSTPLENYVYLAEVNGQQLCVIFDGLFENISGVDTVILLDQIGSTIDGSCLSCLSNLQPSPSPTPTPTTTPTPTPSPTGCISFSYRITNTNPFDLAKEFFINVTVTDCNNNKNIISIQGGTSQIVCSSTYPTSDNPQNTTISLLPTTC